MSHDCTNLMQLVSHKFSISAQAVSMQCDVTVWSPHVEFFNSHISYDLLWLDLKQRWLHRQFTADLIVRYIALVHLSDYIPVDLEKKCSFISLHWVSWMRSIISSTLDSWLTSFCSISTFVFKCLLTVSIKKTHTTCHLSCQVISGMCSRERKV